MSIVKDIRGIARGVKCWHHWITRPGGTPYVMEINPLLKNVTQSNLNAISKLFKQPLTKYIKKKDAYGRPIPNFKDRIYPEISANLAKEKIYKKESPECNRCRACLIK